MAAVATARLNTGEAVDASRARNRNLLQRGLDLVTSPLRDALEADVARPRGGRWPRWFRRPDNEHRSEHNDLTELLELAVSSRSWGHFVRQFGQQAPEIRHHLGLLQSHHRRLADEMNLHLPLAAGQDWDEGDVLAGIQSVRAVLVALDVDDAPASDIHAECLRRVTESATSRLAEIAEDPGSPEGLTAQTLALSRLLGARLDEDEKSSRAPDESESLGDVSPALSEPIATEAREENHEEFQEPVKLQRATDPERPEADKVAPLEEAPTPLVSSPPTSESQDTSRSRPSMRHGQRWTGAEDRKLIEGWRAGTPITELATELQRSRNAVSNRQRITFERHRREAEEEHKRWARRQQELKRRAAAREEEERREALLRRQRIRQTGIPATGAIVGVVPDCRECGQPAGRQHDCNSWE